MREIKFRAPDGVTGQYVYFALCDLGTANDSFGLSLDLSKAEQYTGLKDKNGKEIYEGDIVKAWVDFGPGGEGLRIYNVEITPHGTSLQEWTFKEKGYAPEVVGNIHENPELL